MGWRWRRKRWRPKKKKKKKKAQSQRALLVMKKDRPARHNTFNHLHMCRSTNLAERLCVDTPWVGLRRLKLADAHTHCERATCGNLEIFA